ncbi:transcriptional regulator with XRE-family HTH domain [Labrenzia sp. EL_208]|nr:transcriptional regulator with XRE-family HTH domain [Labrenzia sp. EL_132]MBG6227138.1 transcriptional regulator with XRE-family HTH domain [Labrenzia sp. EL_208]
MARNYRTHADPAGDEKVKGAPKNITKDEFARRLYKAMVSKGWNQSELGRQANISRDAISTYMTARNFPSPDNLSKLSKALDIEPDNLVPNYGLSAMEKDQPELEMKVSPADPSTAYLRISRRVTVATALKVLELVNNDVLPDEVSDAN